MPVRLRTVPAMFVTAALCAITSTASVYAGTGADAEGHLARARAQMGTNLGQARASVSEARKDAIAAHRLDLRLAADELDCRILSDTDASAAATIAAEGLAAATGLTLSPSERNASLRLRACWAGAQLDVGVLPANDPTLSEIINQAQTAALEPARAMAQLERGLHRSRYGDLLDGQADLLAACDSLHRLALPRDEELCLGHLANHYKRMGDMAEALRLLEYLDRAADARGAVVDRAVYVFGIAQVHATNEEWEQALAAYETSSRLNRELHDDLGFAYALEGLSDALLHLGRPHEARPRVEQALQVFRQFHDVGQELGATLLLARALRALGDYTHAAGVLAGAEPALARVGTEYQQRDWLESDADVQGHLGHYQRAFESLDRWRVLTTRTHAQTLSENAGRLRMQFNRERDAAALQSMQQLNAQSEQLRRTQAAVLSLVVLLAVGATTLAVRKVRLSRRLQVLASTDELTGTMNRRAVMTFATTALARAQEDQVPLSLLLIDVDHFKRINDRHGHPAGDGVLVELTRRVQGRLRANDRLGRVGGEEFMVVLPATAGESAALIAERMRAVCQSTPVGTTDGLVPITISIGLATAAPGSSLTALIAQADAALYAAKSSGRNAVVSYTPALSVTSAA